MQIVAGGGGGGGGGRVSTEFTATGAVGGGASARGADNSATVLETGTAVLANGGRPGANGAAGAGGVNGSVRPAPGTVSETTQIRSGRVGGAATAPGAGAAGGNGRLTSADRVVHISGAGGGGYGGGDGGDYLGSAVAESATSLAWNGSIVESRRTPGSITITY